MFYKHVMFVCLLSVLSIGTILCAGEEHRCGMQEQQACNAHSSSSSSSLSFSDTDGCMLPTLRCEEQHDINHQPINVDQELGEMIDSGQSFLEILSGIFDLKYIFVDHPDVISRVNRWIQLLQVDEIHWKKDETILRLDPSEDEIRRIDQLNQSLMDNPAGVDAFNTNPLHPAAFEGEVNLVDKFIRLGMDINALSGGWGCTPLMLASQRGHVDVVERLLEEENIDIHKEDVKGRTALSRAASSGSIDVVDRLMARGVYAKKDDIFTVLEFPVSVSTLGIIDRLITMGCDASAIDADGRTLLMACVARFDDKYDPNLPGPFEVGNIVDIMDRLISVGADVNALDNEGNTVLTHCVNLFRGRLSATNASDVADVTTVMTQLLRERADVRISNREGKRAIDRVPAGEELDGIRRLLGDAEKN